MTKRFYLGSKRLRLRGVNKGGGEWTLFCLIHNIEKIYGTITAKGAELDELAAELQVAYNPRREGASSAQIEGDGRRKTKAIR